MTKELTLIMGLLRILFSKYKVEVFTAFDHKKYLAVANKLRTHGVDFQTAIKRNNNMHPRIGQIDNAHYYIYVKEEDKHQAQMAIHRG